MGLVSYDIRWSACWGGVLAVQYGLRVIGSNVTTLGSGSYASYVSVTIEGVVDAWCYDTLVTDAGVVLGVFCSG